MSEENNNDDINEKEESTEVEVAQADDKDVAAVEGGASSDNKVDEDNPDSVLADGTAEGFQWFIAKTLTGQENKVTKALRERVVNYKKTEFFSRLGLLL